MSYSHFLKRGLAAMSCVAMLASPVSALAFDLPSQVYEAFIRDTGPWQADIEVHAHMKGGTDLPSDLWVSSWIKAEGSTFDPKAILDAKGNLSMTTDIAMGDGKLRVRGEMRFLNKTAYLRVTGIEGSYEDVLAKMGITINQKKWLEVPLDAASIEDQLPMEFGALFDSILQQSGPTWDEVYDMQKTSTANGTRYTLTMKQGSALQDELCGLLSATCTANASTVIEFNSADRALSSNGSFTLSNADGEVTATATSKKLTTAPVVQKPTETISLEEVTKLYGSFSPFGVPDEYCVGACDLSQPRGRNMQRRQDASDWGYAFADAPQNIIDSITAKPMEICKYGEACRGISIDDLLSPDEASWLHADPSAPTDYPGTRYFVQSVEDGLYIRVTAPDAEEGATIAQEVYYYGPPYPDGSYVDPDAEDDAVMPTRTTTTRPSRRSIQQEEWNRQDSKEVGTESARAQFLALKPLSVGSAQAPVMVVEFSDYQCPFCQRYAEEMFPQIKKDYIDTNQVLWLHMHYPLSFHKNAWPMATAVECARETSDAAAWKLNNAFFATGDGAFDLTNMDILDMAKDAGADIQKCYMTQSTVAGIQAQAALAESSGLMGTPHFVIIDQSGNVTTVAGASDDVRKTLESLLK